MSRYCLLITEFHLKRKHILITLNEIYFVILICLEYSERDILVRQPTEFNKICHRVHSPKKKGGGLILMKAGPSGLSGTKETMFTFPTPSKHVRIKLRNDMSELDCDRSPFRHYRI